ncbi:MAG: hypothetical protein ACFFBR_11020, partial [Promethearchaeota archaeon]
VHIDFKRIWVIANRFPSSMINETSDSLEQRLANEGLDLAGIVPANDQIVEFNLKGRSLLELPDDHPAVLAIDKIAKRIGLLSEEQLLELLGHT